jgi:hypothetical protein
MRFFVLHLKTFFHFKIKIRLSRQNIKPVAKRASAVLFSGHTLSDYVCSFPG